MRLLVIGALLATLIGCCRAPPQASLERCTSKGCIHRTAANPPVELKPVSFRPGPATANVKFITTAKTAEPASTQSAPPDRTPYARPAVARLSRRSENQPSTPRSFQRAKRGRKDHLRQV